MTPPALTIEQLVDALVDKTWWCAQAGESEVDAAKAECKDARSALLAAIRSQVPADLAGLLRRIEKNDTIANDRRPPVDAMAIDRARRDFWDAAKALTAWTRANLKETP